MKTKILLLRPSGVIVKESRHLRAIRPPYLLKYVEALLKRNSSNHVKLIDCLISPINPRGLIDSVFEYEPDIICIYQLSTDDKFAQKFIDQIGQKIKPLFIICGQGALDHSVYANNLPDKKVVILKGEAEETIAELVRNIQASIPIDEIIDKFNSSVRILVDDPNRLPHPTYTLKELSRYSFCYPIKHNRLLKWGHVLSGRGCPYGCTFCSPVMRESYGTNMRLRSPKSVVQEIIYQKGLGVNIFSFDDDDFTANRKHVYSICNELIESGVDLPWIVHARVDEVDEKMLQLMKKAGCVLLRFGIESASERVLLNIHKGNPHRWINLAKNAFTRAQAIGIGTVALFFIGAPGERREDVEASIRFAVELNPDILQVSFFTPYPGSKIYEEVKDAIEPNTIGKLYHYSAPLLNLSQIDTRDLIKLQRQFYREVIFRRAFLVNHIKKFYIFYINNLRLTFSLFIGALQSLIAKKLTIPSHELNIDPIKYRN